MSKEIYISSTPHETRLAIVENDALTEIYYERENEYTLAGSIYNGKVTRVLPGMQSSFVDIGLERDAFLYITDFMEEAPDSAEFDTVSEGDSRAARLPRLEGSGDSGAQKGEGQRSETQRTEGQRSEGQRSEGQKSDGQRTEGQRGEGRGERNNGGRGRRGRNDRGDRTPQVDRAAAPEFQRPDAAPEVPRVAPVVSIPPAYSAEAVDGGEIGEGAPGADGSRRWRGRRGRRRGRGPGQAEQAAAQSVAPAGEAVIFPAEVEAESIENFTSELLSLESAEPVEAAPGQSYNESRRSSQGERSGRGDQGGRGDRGGRDRGRGREERGGREDRGPRSSSRSSYGLESNAEVLSDAPVGEPLILPGESLGKYRKGDPEVKAASTIATPAPSSEYAIPTGWDGGATLPGESLSRHRRTERSAEPQASVRVPSRANYTNSAPVAAAPVEHKAAVIEDEDGLSVAETPEPQTEVAFAAHPEQVPAEEIGHDRPTHQDDRPSHEADVEFAPAFEAAETEPSLAAEYEPEEGSASYRVDPAAPSEYRQSAPVEVVEAIEPVSKPAYAGETVAEEAVAAEPQDTALVEISLGHTHLVAPAPPVLTESDESAVQESAFSGSDLTEPAAETVLPDHDVVTLSDSGEMFSEAVVLDPVHTPAPLEQPEPTAPILHETAVLDATDLVEEHMAAFEEEDEEPATQSFAPGSGDLEEELFEEDEFEVASMHGSHDDENDDLEEETLEGAADLGTMLREMSIDQITRPGGDPDDDDEDFLEEDFVGESEETGGADFEDEEEDSESDSEEAARTAESAGDFSGEFLEPVAGDAAAGEGQSYNERRGGRRDARRGGRDRDKRGGDSSGRPRNTGGGGDRDRGRSGGQRRSMQATNLPAISELLKPGQEILVQIAKEPIAKKGARITSHIALPGRFLVFMPTVNHTGVSRKIESDGERRRLKEILLSEKGEAAGGFIVRTAASGATEEELRSDLRFLLKLWTDIKQRSESSKSPALIYHDLNLVERILRDQVTDTFSAIWVDTETEYERVLRFLQRFQPSLIRRVKLYGKETPLFEQFGITEEINKALRSKVWLKSGGSIVINQTEALVAIDINTGKFVGKTARLEDTIVKTNLDAIPEIVRQIRLRDLGGIIIIDFIDMDERKNRNKVMAALEEELKSDRAPSKVLQFNDFGLVAITRKRVKQSLERTLSTTCNVCVGTGMVKSPVTVCNDIYIEMRKMYKHLDKGDVMLRVHPEVVKQLKSPGTKWLQEMEEMSGKTILVKSDPSLHPEQFDIH